MPKALISDSKRLLTEKYAWAVPNGTKIPVSDKYGKKQYNQRRVHYHAIENVLSKTQDEVFVSKLTELLPENERMMCVYLVREPDKFDDIFGKELRVLTITTLEKLCRQYDKWSFGDKTAREILVEKGIIED